LENLKMNFKSLKMNFKQLEIFAGESQLQTDEISFILIKERNELSFYSVLQDYCDFNVFRMVKPIPWLYGKKAIEFIVMNGKSLKRKLSYHEFFNICEKYRILSIKNDIKDFEDFKRYKIS